MIVFITAHDEPTNDNLQVAGHIADTAAVGLCGTDAVRDNVLPALEAEPNWPFLALSHGRPTHLCGNNCGEAVGVDDVLLLKDRVSFALACFTAETVGPTVAAAGGTWLGYVGPVNCLPADPATIQHFIDIADFIEDRFPGCNSNPAAEAFIADLDGLTNAIFQNLEENGNYDFEVFHAIRDITRRLRIWLPNVQEAIRHAEGYGDPIL